jgi:hypothetical protein
MNQVYKCKHVLLKYTKSTTTCQNWVIYKHDSHNLSTSITNKIDRNIQACDIAMIKMNHFSRKFPSHEHRTYTWSKWAQTTYSPQTSCKVIHSHQKIITNTYKLSHVMSKPPSHVSTSRYETSRWWTSCNGLAPKIKNLKHLWHRSKIFNHRHLTYQIHDLQFKLGTWSAFCGKKKLRFLHKVACRLKHWWW